MITLTTAALGNPYTHIKADGSDIRFSTNPPPNSGTELSYWVESWVVTGTSTIWVKVPNLPTGDSYIYMYYGNSSANAVSNGSATFDLFDNFNDGDYTNNPTWTVVAGTTWIASSGYLQNTEAAAGIRIPSTLTGESWEWRANLPDYTSNWNDNEIFFMTTDTSGSDPYTQNAYAIAFGRGGPNNSDFSLQKCVNGTWTKLIQGSGFSTGWHKYKITRTSTGLFQLFFDDVSQGTYTDTTFTSSIYFLVRHWGGSTACSLQFDDLRIRKYASPEPSAAAPGSESPCYTGSLVTVATTTNWTSLIAPGQKVVMGQSIAQVSFSMAVTGTTTAHWKRFRVDKFCRAGQALIPDDKIEVQLWMENNGDGFFDAGDQLITKGTFTNNTCYLNLTRRVIDATPHTYYIVYKFAPDCGGGQFAGVNIGWNGYLEFDEGIAAGVPP